MARKLSPQKRAGILHNALKLFVSNGVKNTSTAEIAKAAGIAAGTLFLYFPTKQDLLDDIAIELSKEQAEKINRLLAPSLSARETFFSIWSGTVAWFLENMDAYQYIQQVRDTGLISERAIQETGQMFTYYFSAIQKGHQEGTIKPYPPDLIGGFLYFDLVAIVAYLRMQAEADRDVIIRQGFEIFWDGIKR